MGWAGNDKIVRAEVVHSGRAKDDALVGARLASAGMGLN